MSNWTSASRRDCSKAGKSSELPDHSARSQMGSEVPARLRYLVLWRTMERAHAGSTVQKRWHHLVRWLQIRWAQTSSTVLARSRHLVLCRQMKTGCTVPAVQWRHLVHCRQIGTCWGWELDQHHVSALSDHSSRPCTGNALPAWLRHLDCRRPIGLRRVWTHKHLVVVAWWNVGKSSRPVRACVTAITMVQLEHQQTARNWRIYEARIFLKLYSCNDLSAMNVSVTSVAESQNIS